MTGGHNFLRRAYIEGAEDDRRTQEAGSKHVGLCLGFGLVDKVITTGEAFFHSVTKDDVPKLVRNGKTAGIGTVVLVHDDIPLCPDLDGSPSITGSEDGGRAVGHHQDTQMIRNGFKADGEAIDLILDQAVPRRVSGVFIDIISHLYHPLLGMPGRGDFYT